MLGLSIPTTRGHDRCGEREKWGHGHGPSGTATKRNAKFYKKKTMPVTIEKSWSRRTDENRGWTRQDVNRLTG